LATVALAACGGDEPEPAGESSSASSASESAASEGPITIGVASSQSGPISAYDGPILAAMKLAAEDVNEKGGAAGREIRFVTADNKTDLQLVKSTAQRVLDQGAQILVPTCDYDFGGPAAQVADEKGILAISCAGSPLFGKQGLGENVYNTYQATPTEAASVVAFAKKQGYKKPYILTDTTLEYTKNLSQYFEQIFKAQVPDGQIAGKDTFQNPDTSIASQVTRIKNSGADTVVLSSYMPGGATAIKQLRAGGVDLPVLGGIAFDGGPVWTKAIPSLSDFYYTGIVSMFGDDPDPKVNEFYARFEEETGSVPPSSLSVTGYDTITTLVKAIEGAGGSTDGAKLREQLDAFTDVELLAGKTTYTEDCHIPVGRPMRIISIEKGEPKFVDLPSIDKAQLPEAPC
jgi:branched-chain amino acid transport system substrate-binding protein